MTIKVEVTFTKEERESIHQVREIIDELANKMDEHGVHDFEELDYDELKFIANSLDNIERRIVKDWRNENVLR